jgi:hypothetical protein
MGPRSTFGAGPLRLAVGLAIVLLAAGASATISGVAGDGVHASARPANSVYLLPPQFELPPSCPFVALDPYGVCPLPAIYPRPWTRRAMISLCLDALCGSGFRPGDTILLLATRSEGSTFWRTVADRAGNFRSPLPAPLCRFAPIGLTASDNHAQRSNRLSLASTGCEGATPSPTRASQRKRRW